MSVVGEHENIPYALRGLGTIAIDQENFEYAQTILNEALEGFRNSNDQYGQVITLRQLGRLAHIQQDIQQALTYYETGLAIARRSNIHLPMIKTLISMASTELVAGNREHARDHLQQGLQRAMQVPLPLMLLHGLVGMGHLALLEDNPIQAARLAGVVSGNTLTTPALQRFYVRPLLSSLRETLDEITLNNALNEGKKTSASSMIAVLLHQMRQVGK